MTPKSCLALAGITVAAVALAALSSGGAGSGAAIGDRGKPLIAGLSGKAAQIASISAEGFAGKTELTRRDGALVDASGYPAKTDAVRSVATGLALLTIEEAKTSDPARHKDLELAAPGAGEGAGERITLKDASGKVIADVILGKRDYTVGGTRGGQYVRLADSDQAYLVRGAVEAPSNRAGWFDARLAEFGEDAIQRVTLGTGEATQITIEKEGEAHVLKTVPEGRQADPQQVRRVVRIFTPLTFTDVRKATGDTAPAGPVLTAVTRDGLTVRVQALDAKRSEEANWFRVTATTEGEAAKAGAEAISKASSGFDFELAGGDVDVFWYSAEDVTTKAGS